MGLSKERALYHAHCVNRFKEVPHFFLRHGTSRRVSSLLEIFHVPADKITFIDKDSEHGGMDLGDLGTRLDFLKECSPVVIWLSLGDNNGTVDNLNDVRAVIKGRPNVHNGLDSISLPLSEFFGIAVIKEQDPTVPGSRIGHLQILLWVALHARETHSRTLIEKWNLKKMSGFKNSYKFELLPHFTRSKLDLFIEDKSPSQRTPSLMNFQRLPTKFSNYITDFKRTINGLSDQLRDILTILEYNVTQRSVKEFEKDIFQYMSGILRIPLMNYMPSLHLVEALVISLDNPIIYVSHDAHYSMFKYTQILRMELIIVKSQETGELNYDDLERHIKDNLPRPAIISLNIGSTLKGAIDSIKKTKAILNKLKLTQFHIHCDAALDGGFLPLICDTPQHGFDMGIDSLAISLIKDIIEDIFSVKDGIITALLWYAVNRQRTISPGTEAKQQLEKAEYLYQNLRGISYPAGRNQYSNIVYFKKPSPEIIAKWKLATIEEISHIVLMQHIDYDILNEFLEDMKEYNQK
ncbi:Uncharacterized protein FKW44_000165 [Caligus rogercresseyi]|uniref:Uncharacterized protein n=1 Tax=Caligus rogercresseyi TaxID=217165 RepID=A0A7T8QUN4_CALRO|nr:Uncharacterized protein FKW44_000165 [Caligus rogercresseyi]